MSDWKETLAPTPQCVDIARLGEELTAADREHVATCVRCQSELALYNEITSEETTAAENDAAQWIAAHLEKQNNVVAFRPRRWQVMYAVAAALAIVIGISTWSQLREPAIDTPAGITTYRSARLELIAPIGDLAQPPNELRWSPVSKASLYRVRILEVDRTAVWSADTNETRIVLPPHVSARFVPGKTLLWEVEAFRGTEAVAKSESESVRVSVPPIRTNS